MDRVEGIWVRRLGAIIAALLLCGLPALPVLGQTRDVVVRLDPSGDFTGLGGYVRPGRWTPLRVTLTNQSSELRELSVQWVLEDEDGDRVVSERTATLNPMRAEVPVWLYACPPTTTRRGDTGWKVRVVDTATGKQLGTPVQVPVRGDRFLRPGESVIGLMSSIELGLAPYASGATTHDEFTRLATGLKLTTLPDRWYGLSAYHTLVWTYGDGEGGDPNDALITDDMQDALRGWVKRGGHLVIVLPAFAEPWTGSELADLLPVGKDQMRRVEALPPLSVGVPKTSERAPVSMTVFDVPVGGDVEVIERDRDKNPVVVAKRYGFGRVTLVGVDLADRGLVKMGLPNGKWTIWHKVFGWRAPAFTKAQVESQRKMPGTNSGMVEPGTRHGSPVVVGERIPARINMTGTATPALLLAIVVFGVYWLIAGPGSFSVLRMKKLHHHAWVGFLVVVAVFTAVAWGAAFMVRNNAVSVNHFSVLDIDGNTGEARARGWATVFIPGFGRSDVTLDPANPERGNVLASPGIVTGTESAGFPDQQSYRINAGDPHRAAVPVRATSKRFAFDFLGRLDDDREGVTEPWVGPMGDLKLVNFLPSGTLKHGLPGALEDVLVVYCPGDNQLPRVWLHRKPWKPADKLDIGALVQTPASAQLTVPNTPRNYLKDRQWATEGFLGLMINNKTAVPKNLQPLFPQGSRRDDKQQLWLLSFFDLLPPPNFRNTDFGGFGPGRSTTYHRQVGRDLDLSELTSGRRLILIGLLRGPHFPAPLTIDGKPLTDVSEDSSTFVRWVYDLN